MGTPKVCAIDLSLWVNWRVCAGGWCLFYQPGLHSYNRSSSSSSIKGFSSGIDCHAHLEALEVRQFNDERSNRLVCFVVGGCKLRHADMVALDVFHVPRIIVKTTCMPSQGLQILSVKQKSFQRPDSQPSHICGRIPNPVPSNRSMVLPPSSLDTS